MTVKDLLMFLDPLAECFSRLKIEKGQTLIFTGYIVPLLLAIQG